MPKGVYERKPKEPDMSPPEVVTEKLFPVILSKNYCPRGNYEIIGYLKEEVKQKDSAGVWRILEKEEFVSGEMKPHVSPGVGFPDKIWAGTTIALPFEEAKAVIAKKIAERADDLAA